MKGKVEGPSISDPSKVTKTHIIETIFKTLVENHSFFRNDAIMKEEQAFPSFSSSRIDIIKHVFNPLYIKKIPLSIGCFFLTGGDV